MEEDDNYDPILYMMEPHAGCSKIMEDYQTALYKVLSKKGVDPMWLPPEEAKLAPYMRNEFYIFTAFEGEAFEHIDSIGCKIYGPMVAEHALEKGIRLPKRDHPLFSMTLEGSIVCFTGIDRDRKVELGRLVRWMGGVVSNELHDKVTVLVAETCDTESKKYVESSRLQLPVVTPQWILDGWKKCVDEISLEYWANDDILDQYRVKIFSGLEMTVSGVRTIERADIARLIEVHGGRFSAAMNKNTCTHLISDNNSGEKFRKAREWKNEKNLKIVQLRWLQKCAESGYRLKEKHFDPERVRSSTPTKTTVPQHDPLCDLDVSMIGEKGNGAGRLNNSTLSLSFSSQNSVPNTTILKSLSTNRNENSRNLFVNATVEADDTMRDEQDLLQGLEMSLFDGDADFLEGVRVYLLGVEEAKEGQWRKLLNWTGATRVTRVEGSTHVAILSLSSPSLRSVLAVAAEKRLRVVRAEWLVDCAREKRLLPTQDYIFDEKAARVSANQKQRTVSQNVAGPLSSPKGVAEAVEDERSEGGLVMAAERNGSGSFLQGITFKLLHLMEKEAKVFTTAITRLSGRVVDSDAPAHYLLCPLIEFEASRSPAQHGCQDIVTAFWLQYCCESGRIHPPSSNPLFRPIPAVRDSSIFSDLVVAIHGISSHLERDAFTYLLGVFGALLQKDVRRSDKDLLRRSTHIVIGKNQDELRKAREWGVKIVDPSWIIECIINDRVLLEDNFPFKEMMMADYRRQDDIWEWKRVEREREEKEEREREEKEREQEERERMELDEEAPLEDASTLVMDPDEMEAAVHEERNALRKKRMLASLERETSHSLSRVEEGRGSAIQSQRIAAVRAEAATSISSPSHFLHPHARPGIHLPGAMELVDAISSPSAMDSSQSSLSTSMVGRLLNDAVERTGRLGMETPARAASARVASTVPLNALTEERREKERETVTTEEHERMKRVVSEKLSAALSTNRAKKAVMEERRESGQSMEGRGIRRKRIVDLEESPGPPPKKIPPQEKKDLFASEMPRVEWQAAEDPDRSIAIPSGLFSDSPSEDVPRSAVTDPISTQFVPPTPVTDQNTSDGAIPTAVPASSQRVPSTRIPDPAPPQKAPPTRVSGAALSEKTPHSRVSGPAPEEAPPTYIPGPAPSGRTSPGECAPRTRKGRSSVLPPSIPPTRLRRSINGPGGGFVGKKQVWTEAELKTKAGRRRTKEDVLRPPCKKVAFSSFAESEERTRLAALVESLGGEVSSSKDYDPTVTHLVCGKMVRNEKLLGAMASGQWVLQAEWLQKSADAGDWMQEEKGEWTAEAAGEERQRAMAAACRKWRRRLQAERTSRLVEGEGGKVGAFVQWKAVLYAKQRSKVEGLVRLIRAGGGIAEVRDDVLNLAAFAPTHALVDPASIDMVQPDFGVLRSLGSKVLASEFIARFLLDDSPSESASTLPQFRDLVK